MYRSIWWTPVWCLVKCENGPGTAAVEVVAAALAGAAEVPVVGTGMGACLEAGAGAGGMGVKRKRCTWPLGMAACMSCWPGLGMTVTPAGMSCSWPVVWPCPWITTVRP